MEVMRDGIEIGNGRQRDSHTRLFNSCVRKPSAIKHATIATAKSPIIIHINVFSFLCFIRSVRRGG